MQCFVIGQKHSKLGLVGRQPAKTTATLAERQGWPVHILLNGLGRMPLLVASWQATIQIVCGCYTSACAVRSRQDPHVEDDMGEHLIPRNYNLPSCRARKLSSRFRQAKIQTR